MNIDLFKIDGLITHRFVSLQTYGLNCFLLLDKLPIQGVDIIFEKFADLPIGRLYDISMSDIFIGNLFEVPKSYHIDCKSNYLAIYKRYQEYENVYSCMSNERFTCFTEPTQSSLIVVNNNQHFISIDK
jgi:hypothetical protein